MLPSIKHLKTKFGRDILDYSPQTLFQYSQMIMRNLMISRGECYIPAYGRENWRDYGDLQNVVHLLRYEWAVEVLSRRDAKCVLDLACGCGYGSYALGSAFECVYGIDANPAAVRYAKKHYGKDNIKFLQGDFDTVLNNFEAGMFDAIVSFETIENAIDERWLDVFEHLLKKPDGILLLSTPIVPETTRRPPNNHHTIEYSKEDLIRLIKTKFSTIYTDDLLPCRSLFLDAHKKFNISFDQGIAACVAQ